MDYNKSNVNLFYVTMIVFHVGSWVFDNLREFYPGAKRHVEKFSELKDVMQVVLCNQILVLLPWMILLDWLGWTDYADGFNLLGLFRCLFFGQVFYYSIFHTLHHMLHWPIFYRFHKLHHQSKALRAATAFYMTGFDFLLEVVIPASAWLLYHPTEQFIHACILISLGILTGLYQHSGWNLCPTSFMFSSSDHFQHHCPSVNVKDTNIK